MERSAGSMAHHYRIESVVARGRFTIVYRSFDTKNPRVVALRQMKVGTDERIAPQFRAEFAALSRLRHPNLPEVSDYFEDGDEAFFVMDFVQATPLSTVLEVWGHAPPRRVLAQLGGATAGRAGLSAPSGSASDLRDSVRPNVVVTPERLSQAARLRHRKIAADRRREDAFSRRLARPSMRRRCTLPTSPRRSAPISTAWARRSIFSAPRVRWCTPTSGCAAPRWSLCQAI